MVRFAGIKNNNICIISDKPFVHQDFQVIEIPDELNNISLKELIVDYKIKEGKIIAKRSKKSAKELKVALVSNWKMKCGIATYANFLYTELINRIGDYKLFIEENDTPTEPINNIGGENIPSDKILSCWKRGDSTFNLVKAIKEYDPDIILIQHEFGLFPNARHWISMMNQLSEYRVIVTMHSVFHHKDKAICEAAMPEIVVHLEGAKPLLKEEKQISGKVYVIPHGCLPCIDKSKLWNIYKSEHTIIQVGFLFKYKGWENVIKAVALLKNKYPDVFFTGICSESPFNKSEHQMYYNELMELIESLNLQDNVGLIRGYQSENILDNYLRANNIAIFPYVSSLQHEVFGASGAARISMTKGIPIITTYVNHFSDLPSIKAGTVEEIAEAADKLFSDKNLIKEQVDKQCLFLEENSWENVAKKYINLFEK